MADRSTELNAEEAVSALADLDSVTAVQSFTEGDERKTVREAADVRMAELGEASGFAEPPVFSEPTLSEMTELQGVIPGAAIAPEAAPGSPLTAGGSGKVRVRTRFPVTSHDSQVPGVGVIPSTGVEIDRSKVAAVLDSTLVTTADGRVEQVVEIEEF